MSNSCTYMSPLTGLLSEKYWKKLVGRTDVEDALKRLDKLTNEEARMATAQVLKATNTVDDRVGGVADKVLGVDTRVADIDERVRAVDNKVTGVVDGAQTIFRQPLKICFILVRPDGKEAKALMQQATNDLDQAKRS